jgi:hypothetical protein
MIVVFIVFLYVMYNNVNLVSSYFVHEKVHRKRYVSVSQPPGPRLMKKKKLPSRGLTKVENHCDIWFSIYED